jgi:chemotaxis protein MotB
MSRDAAKNIIIIRKKKAAHGGQHGGSWKVAYADFVTAMMAFFMVMWIIGMDQHTREAIEGYFSNPVGYKKGYSAGKSPISSGNSPGTVKTIPVRLVNREDEEKIFDRVGAKIHTRLIQENGLGTVSAQVEVVVTSSGLRIELIEGNSGDMFFPIGSAEVKPAAHKVLQIIASELSTLSNPVIIEGHTDSAPYSGVGYSNWELSTERANAARRVMQDAGIQPQRIAEVRGLADRHLRVPTEPLSPANRRISILLPFRTPPPTESDGSQPDSVRRPDIRPIRPL